MDTCEYRRSVRGRRGGSVLLYAVVCGACGALSGAASGSSVSFDLDMVFSGDTPPEAAPWLRATFENLAGGVVRLTMENLMSFAGGGDVDEWYFNYDPGRDAFGGANELTISYNDVLSTTPLSGTVSTGVNAFQADGDGLFDILFSFPAGNPANRFRGGQVSVWDISGPIALTASMFNHLSFPAGGHGPFPTASHIRFGADSAWITVIPLPAPAGLTLAGLMLIAASRRRKLV